MTKSGRWITALNSSYSVIKWCIHTLCHMILQGMTQDLFGDASRGLKGVLVAWLVPCPPAINHARAMPRQLLPPHDRPQDRQTQRSLNQLRAWGKPANPQAEADAPGQASVDQDWQTQRELQCCDLTQHALPMQNCYGNSWPIHRIISHLRMYPEAIRTDSPIRVFIITTFINNKKLETVYRQITEWIVMIKPDY